MLRDEYPSEVKAWLLDAEQEGRYNAPVTKMDLLRLAATILLGRSGDATVRERLDNLARFMS